MLASRITGAVDDLLLFPRLGRIVSDFQDEAIRELIVEGYRVIYRLIGEDEVWILTVVHGSRDLRHYMASGPWDIG